MLKIQQLKEKIRSINPMILFGIVTLILGLILLFETNFKTPDFYIDYDAANKLIDMQDEIQADKMLKQLENKNYKIFNSIFHGFSLSLIFLLISIVFKTKTINELFNINLMKNKKFIYPWINISYILYTICWLGHYMRNLENYVYPSNADSIGIPLFFTFLTMAYMALIYYPGVNILFFITYNTKICGRIYSFIFILGFFYYIQVLIYTLFTKFSFWTFWLQLYLIITFLLIFSALQTLKEKRIQKKKACAQIF